MRRVLSLIFILLWGPHLLRPSYVSAQTPAPLATADDLGLRLPEDATAILGKGRRVLIPSEVDGQMPAIGKVHLEVGDRMVVTQPNGSLRVLSQSEATVTDRPFMAADKKVIEKQLAEQFAGFKIRDTRRYLYVYDTSEPFYLATSRILESMHPKLVAYCRRHKLSTESLDVPLVVVMFRTEAEFQKYRPVPETILAYYNTISNRVVLYEQSSLAQVAPTIAAKQSISTIAHEGVHQILHNIGVQQRLAAWPMWISEGLPEYFAPTSVERRIKWKGVGLPNDLRMRELIQHVKQHSKLVGSGNLVRSTVVSERLTSTGYAVAWALTHYLATTHREAFLEYLREVCQIQPLAEPSDEEARFTKHFGNNFRELEVGMLKHIRGLPYVDPIANQPHYMVLARTPSRKMALLTTSPLSVRKARGQILAKLAPVERHSVQFSIQAFPNKAVADQAMQVFSQSR